jgi:hypothetical protein
VPSDEDGIQIPRERIEARILLLRGLKVMLDSDLADLYGVATKVLVQAVKRNQERFPSDFMIQLTAEEFAGLRSQFVTSNSVSIDPRPSAAARGGRKHRPFAFTEQGVAMLSGVLHSPRAIRVNIEIMRAFARLRRILLSHAELARRLDELERHYDQQFRVVFDAIRQLMAPPEPQPKRVGFRADPE